MKEELLKNKEGLMQWLERILENNPKDQDNDIKEYIESQIKKKDSELSESTD